MLYLSQVLGRPIRDLEGERVATVKDVIVRLGADDHPPVQESWHVIVVAISSCRAGV